VTRPLTPAHRTLAETHLDVAHRAAAAARRRVPASAWDDVLGAAYEGLCSAARDWDADLDPVFTRYAWFRCDHAIGDEMRRQAWFSRSAYENGAETPVGPGALDYLTDTADVEAEAVHAHLCGHVARIVPSLRPSLRHVYTRVYIDGARIKAVGVELGVSESRVSQLCRQLAAELRDAIVIGAAA
jgi:RNA polymerase sigma factor for flagellar operon FliA